MRTKIGKKMRSAMFVQLLVYVTFSACVVKPAHGNEVSPPWITLRGCFNYSNGNATSSIQKNEPTQCFKHCSGFANVGLKNTTCICNPSNNYTRVNRLCNLTCPGKPEVYCGNNGVGDDLISVYTKDIPLPPGMNGITSYGYGYVVVSGGYIIYHASDNNTSLQYGFLCYNDFTSGTGISCQYDKTTSWTWEGAMKECNARGVRPITVSDVSKCSTVAAFDGTYWLGIYRDYPDSITSTRVPIITSNVSLTTTPRSRGTFATNVSTGWTYANNTTHGASTLAAADSSSGGDDTIKIVVGIVCGVLIIGAIVSVVVCKIKRLLCFKSNLKVDTEPS